MTQAFGHIRDCLGTLGTSAFLEHLLALIERTGARQVMIFEIRPNAARCLLSRNFVEHGLGDVLAERYLDGWFRKDPLLPRLMRLKPGEQQLISVDTVSSRMRADYRQIFYRAPELSGKTAILAATPTRRCIVNLYNASRASAKIDTDLAGVIARLAMMHFDLLDSGEGPSALDVLSERERSVCRGILDGKKAELIAADLGVTAATVTTYRKRAYQKLGISSRGALFAICRSD